MEPQTAVLTWVAPPVSVQCRSQEDVGQAVVLSMLALVSLFLSHYPLVAGWR